nr:MAG TPA: hypothetical protein [Caudoviricetes sp.]
MAETTAYPILTVCATKGSRLPDLAITNGQLIFVHDKHKIALDYNGKRTFYNQIIELETEQERTSLLAPVSGSYYFIIDTAVLWSYQESGWIQITTSPQDIVFIGGELPELGSAKTLYVDKLKKELSIWDDITSQYIVVADKTAEITIEEIDELFKQ